MNKDGREAEALRQALEDGTLGKDVQLVGSNGDRGPKIKITGFAAIRRLIAEQDNGDDIRIIEVNQLIRGVVYEFLDDIRANNKAKDSYPVDLYRGLFFCRQGFSEDGRVAYFSAIGNVEERYKEFELRENWTVHVKAHPRWEGQQLFAGVIGTPLEK